MQPINATGTPRRYSADKSRHIEGETDVEIDLYCTPLPEYRLSCLANFPLCHKLISPLLLHGYSYGTTRKSTCAEMVHASLAPQRGLAPATEQQSSLEFCNLNDPSKSTKNMTPI